MSSSGEQPPGSGGGGGKKKPLPSATIIGLTPLDRQPAAPAPAPPAPASPAPPAPAPPPPSGAPGFKRSTLPPPARGPHQPPQPIQPRPSSTTQQPPLSQPPAPAQPIAPPRPSSTTQQPPLSQPPPSSFAAAPPAAPIYEQPSGPTAPFGAATGPHTAPHSGPHAVPSTLHSGPHSAPHAAPSTNPSFPPAPMAPSQPPAAFDGGMFGPPPGGSYGGRYGGDDVPPGSSFDSIEAPGSKFVAFLKISARRAFRLRIEPDEVLPSERRTLEMSSPPVTDRNLMSFLAWRRSVLFLVASALIPLTIIGVIDALQSRKFTPIFFVRGAPALAEGIFAWVCWSQLKKWSSWRQQRRKLFYGWLLFMLMPFVVFMYPLRTIFEDLGGSSREKLLALGVEGAYRQAVMPFVFAMLAMLQLAPKAISLMPGLIRASLVIKLLFPGSSAPGWLMVVAAPLYALLAYVILVIPYQFTGSGWFIGGVLGVIAAQSWLARAGFELAKPMDEAEALRQIKRVRKYYMGVMLLSAILIIVALGSLVAKLNLRATDVITAVLKFETNVLILTMIGADLVVTNLDRARGYTAGRSHVEEQTEVKIAAFVSLEAPSTPPPPGPAQ